MTISFRGSLAARRVGAIVLALFILGYLIGITLWRLDDLTSQRSWVVLVALWGIGLLALTLLVRAWRRS